ITLTGHGNPQYSTALFYGSGKYVKFRIFNQLREIDKLQSKARIGFVRAVGFYSFIIGHTLKWSLDLSPGRVAYDFLHQRFRGAHHLFFVYKGHLYINLGKLRLAISSQILIPKALYNLKIAVKSRYHQ